MSRNAYLRRRHPRRYRSQKLSVKLALALVFHPVWLRIHAADDPIYVTHAPATLLIERYCKNTASSKFENNTMVWFTTDNGPHTLKDRYSLNPEAAARSGGQLCATNGLRQCKASV